MKKFLTAKDCKSCQRDRSASCRNCYGFDKFVPKYKTMDGYQ